MQQPKETVILLHGILCSRHMLQPLARFLEGQGYRVINPGYPSTRYSLEALVPMLHDRIKQWVTGSAPVHFVCHSMGGLLLRSYLAVHTPANLGRVVMLGTPNQGSEVADFLKSWKLYRWVFGPAGQQLVTHFPRSDHWPECDLGIIAGDRSIDPILGRFLPLPHDGKVSVASTRFAPMNDHYVMPVSHTLMVMNRTVWQEILHFLRNGRFAKA